MKQLLLCSCLALVSAPAFAVPVSSCATNVSSSGFTCDVWESVLSGAASEISNLIALPSAVSSGFIYVSDFGVTPLRNDKSTWGDVLDFADNGDGFATTVQLFSLGCNTG